MKVRKILVVVTVLLFLLVSVSAAAYYWYRTLLSAVSGIPTSPVAFSISQNESATSVITRLEKEGLIRSAQAAKIYLRIERWDSHFVPGVFTLSSSSSVPEVFSLLFSGPRDITVTFPEGWRREQIALRLEALHQNGDLPNFVMSEFLTLTENLEGQLFPDTYAFSPQSSTVDIIRRMQRNFQVKSGLNLSSNEVLSSNKLTPLQTLILASLIEREANNADDMYLVSGVIINRLESQWPLQIDATIQYATATRDCARSATNCEWWPDTISTKYDSLFNTYLHPGLPPQSICSPGVLAISAAKNPQLSEYWFYLTGLDGVTRFAKTLTEHNLNVDKYLKP